MDNNTYPKKEKLKQKNELNSVFQNGKWKTHKDLRVVFLKNDIDAANAKFGVSVSKKFFKKAVDRNRIKRLLRECYRLNKTTYHDSFGKGTLAMLFWVSKDLPKQYSEVEIQFLNLCKKIKNT
ncbi:MAG: ribonuclease P protein component [Bacteroidetes bacterium]|nr:ribonuclease P protein component [Bacteroidota bacterium]